MVLEKIRNALRRTPDCLHNEVKFEHCRECNGDCPMIDGCC